MERASSSSISDGRTNSTRSRSTPPGAYDNQQKPTRTVMLVCVGFCCFGFILVAVQARDPNAYLFHLAADFLHRIAFAGDGSDDGRRGDVTVAVDVGVLLPKADVGCGAIDGVDRAGHLRDAVFTVHALDLEVVAVQHRAVQLLLFRLRAALAGATATAAALAMQMLR